MKMVKKLKNSCNAGRQHHGLKLTCMHANSWWLGKTAAEEGLEGHRLGSQHKGMQGGQNRLWLRDHRGLGMAGRMQRLCCLRGCAPPAPQSTAAAQRLPQRHGWELQVRLQSAAVTRAL